MLDSYGLGGPVYKDLADWLEENKQRLRDNHGINLSEDKDQWVIDFAIQIYELGMGRENEFWQSHGHHT